ncbi:MAG: hypothetical protein NVSMB32_01320 [Actinomycetota bacterium]
MDEAFWITAVAQELMVAPRSISLVVRAARKAGSDVTPSELIAAGTRRPDALYLPTDTTPASSAPAGSRAAAPTTAGPSPATAAPGASVPGCSEGGPPAVRLPPGQDGGTPPQRAWGRFKRHLGR